MKKRKRGHKHDPHVAVYLDELDDPVLEDTDEFYEYDDVAPKRSKRTKRSQEKTSKRDKKRKKKKVSIIKPILIFLLLLQTPMLYGILSSFNWKTYESASSLSGTKGILILGVDNDGKDDDGKGHTDSITYIAANFNTHKAIGLPIYRDANILQTCSGINDNINRIYANHNIDCLMDSTANLLGLPLDYYALVTFNGLVNIVNGLGFVNLTPTDTFCSDYGEDNVMYCFDEGVTKKMKGPEALAYIRYRGNTNGERRANRQMELILAIKNRCLNNLLVCYAGATPRMAGGLETNIPIFELLEIASIFNASFDLQTLPVVTGTNTTNALGWTQYVDEYDLNKKTDLILTEIFSKE